MDHRTQRRTRDAAQSSLRATLFFERTRDALYSQVNAVAGGTVATVQNIGAIRTRGFEGAWRLADAGVKGLERQRHADLRPLDHHEQCRTCRPASASGSRACRDGAAAWSRAMRRATDGRPRLGLRYSGRQFGQLDNSDPNGYAYTGFSAYFVADARVQYRFDKQWTGSVGIDNLNNDRYWAFHPYPQRTFHAELRFDL